MWGNQAGILEAEGEDYEHEYRIDQPTQQLALLEREKDLYLG